MPDATGYQQYQPLASLQAGSVVVPPPANSGYSPSAVASTDTVYGYNNVVATPTSATP